MDGHRRSPHADDASCGGGGANSSMTPQESEATEGYSSSAPPTNAHHSGQPGRSIFVDEESSDGPTIGAASSSAWGPGEGEDAKITEKIAAFFLLGPQESEATEGYSPSAPPTSAHHSGQRGRSIFVDEESDGPTIGAASSSAWVPDEAEDPKITDKTAAPFLLGPRRLGSPMGASDSDSDDDRDSWVGFSDRTGGGASTSMSSPDAYDYRAFFGGPLSYEDINAQILGHSFWRPEDEACDDTSQNGSRKIHEKEPLSSLADEFVYKVMKDKSNMLLANYSEYRKVSGDGSCFYRSFIYSYLEQLVKASPGEELRLLGAVEPMLEKFQRLCWPESCTDSHNAFVGLILNCMELRHTLSVSDYEDWLFQECQNENKFAKIISYLRLLTATEICTEADKFRHFIPELDLDNPDVVGWCRRKVIPMDKDALQVHLVELTDVLHVPLRIVNVDISEIAEPNTHIMYESPEDLPLVPCVTLLYRPGHYDILYKSPE